MARPQQLCASGSEPDIIDLAVAYTAGMIRNHPFIDGNKRVGFLIGALFLEMNGYRFAATEEDATRAILGLAAVELDEPTFTAWLRANVTCRADDPARVTVWPPDEQPQSP